MCQVTSFNVDHEKCIQGCNCCKSKDSAAAISATLAERERIIELIIELYSRHEITLATLELLALIEAGTND